VVVFNQIHQLQKVKDLINATPIKIVLCNYLQDMFIAHHKKIKTKSQPSLIQYNLNDYRFIGIVYGSRSYAVAIYSSVYEDI